MNITRQAETLPYDQIPFMHWGIITKYNFTSEKIRYIPRKRWDPLSSAEIRLYDPTLGRLIPIGKRRGHFSYVSPVRGARPEPQTPGKPSKDVFKNIIEGRDYAIFITLDDVRGDNPFSVSPVMLDVKKYRAVTISNRFPAMVRHIDEEIEEKIRKDIEDEYTKIALGINLVTLPTKYYETLSEIPANDLSAIIKSMNVSIDYCVEEARKRGIDLAPVYPFFNIGFMAGGSQPRLHSQVYIDLNMDGHGAFMENLLQAFEEKYSSGYCYLCTSRHDDRIVYENETWMVWVTSSPRRNFHLRLTTKRHVERITNLGEKEINDLAKTLIISSQALDRLGVTRDRNILFYSNPFGYSSFFHIFVDLIPFERIGGIENLDSCRVSRYSPEDVAMELRNIIEKSL